MSDYTPRWGNREAQVREQLAKGIQTLRDALDEAERTLKTAKIDDAVQYIPKGLIWGMANASSSFEAAQMWHNTGNIEKLLAKDEELNRLQAGIDKLRGVDES